MIVIALWKLALLLIVATIMPFAGSSSGEPAMPGLLVCRGIALLAIFSFTALGGMP